MRLRNRWTKATFWTDGALLRWPRDKRHFYQSLWACAEDSCCIEDDMFEVKLTAWASPLDADMTVERFESWRDELIADGKLVPYTNGDPGKRYLYLPDMAKHENPRNPQAPDISLPPWVTVEVTGDGRDRRIRYIHGDREETVENPSGDRGTSPVLPCTALPATDLPATAPPCPSPSDVENDDDAPHSVSHFHALLKVYERLTASCASEATKRTIRAWAEVGYSESGVEAAIQAAIDNKAGGIAKYATAILKRGPVAESVQPTCDPKEFDW